MKRFIKGFPGVLGTWREHDHDLFQENKDKSPWAPGKEYFWDWIIIKGCLLYYIRNYWSEQWNLLMENKKGIEREIFKGSIKHATTTPSPPLVGLFIDHLNINNLFLKKIKRGILLYIFAIYSSF